MFLYFLFYRRLFMAEETGDRKRGIEGPDEGPVSKASHMEVATASLSTTEVVTTDEKKAEVTEDGQIPPFHQLIQEVPQENARE